MNGARGAGGGYPVEDFLQALTAQLDRAQDTRALKDLAIDLRVFMELDTGGRVLLRSAGPNEDGASTVHLSLTTITRPAVEENTRSLEDDTDPRSLEDLQHAAQLDEGDRRKLAWMGVRTVGQLRRLSSEARPGQLEDVVGLPVNKLRAALEMAARPQVTRNEVVSRRDGKLLRIHGANLTDGLNAEVHLDGEPVEVLEAQPDMLLVRPLAHHQEGQLEVLVNGDRATGYFRLQPAGEP